MIETVFRTIISVNQLSIYGAVSDLCEEYKACPVRTGRLVLAGQSDPLFVSTSSLMKTPTLSTDDPAQEDPSQKYQERVERPSQQNRVIKICTDAGFLTTVDFGQCFMTKDTEEFSQFTVSVAGREYTLPRDENISDPKGLIRGNTRIGPVLEVTTSYLQGKYGVEIRIEYVNKDNTHSWVRISHDLNKLVTDLTNKEEDDNEQETSEMQFEDFALKTNVLALTSWSKAKAKPRRRTPVSSFTRTLPIGERYWPDIEPENYSSIAYRVSKQLHTLLRHGHLPREEDGATEFWSWKDHLRNEFENLDIGLMKCGRVKGQETEKKEKISMLYWSVRTRNSLSPSSSRSFRTQSHCSFITGQCTYSERFLRVHLSHRMCNYFTLHHNSGLIPGGQNLSKRQTVFVTSVDPMNNEHKDPGVVVLEAPRLAWFYQKKWKKHQNTEKLAQREDWSSIKHDRTQSSLTTRYQLFVSRELLWWKL